MNNPVETPTRATRPWQFDNPETTLRDYFAAAALPIMRSQNVACGERNMSKTAHDAYRMADAMLKAREVIDDE